MLLYLGTDIFLALMKDEDKYKKSAEKFFYSNKGNNFTTSILTCLEIWFYLYKNSLKDKALDSVRSVMKIAEIQDFSIHQLESAVVLAEQYKLTPVDSVHAILAFMTDAIVSSDSSFDKIKDLKRMDFLKTN